MAKIIADIYSDALFELALEKNMLDQYQEEAELLITLLEENKDIEKLLNHPKISREEKITVVETAFKGRLSDDITGFLVILIQKGRTFELMETCNRFILTIKEYKKIGRADVTSAFALSESQKEKLLNKLLSTTDYKEFEMIYHIDPSLIGGMQVRIKDRVIDNSIKHRLHLLTKNLSNIQLS